MANIGGFSLNFSVAAVIALFGALLALVLDFQDDGDAAKRAKLEHFSIKFKDIIAKECLIFAAVDVAVASIGGIENSFIALYGTSVGIENIGWYFTISAVTLAISRLFFGKLADKKGLDFVLYPGIAFIIIGLLLLWQQSAPWMFAAASIIKTIGVGMVRPAIQAASVKAVSPDRRGAASSTYYIGSDIGQGTSPVIGGKIVDMTGGKFIRRHGFAVHHGAAAPIRDYGNRGLRRGGFLALDCLCLDCADAHDASQQDACIPVLKVLHRVPPMRCPHRARPDNSANWRT